jgi:hypothetical protein
MVRCISNLKNFLQNSTICFVFQVVPDPLGTSFWEKAHNGNHPSPEDILRVKASLKSKGIKEWTWTRFCIFEQTVTLRSSSTIQKLFKGHSIGSKKAPFIFKECSDFNWTEGCEDTFIKDSQYQIGDKVFAIYEGNMLQQITNFQRNIIYFVNCLFSIDPFL